MRIGATLVAARHRAGLTVTQVSQRTRIRPVIIRGIEGDDFSACGGDFYARGHIRSMARAVGADPEPLIRAYDNAYRAPGAMSARAVDELVTLARTGERRRLKWTLAVGLGLAVVLGLGLLTYNILSGSGSAPRAARAAAQSHTVTHRHAGATATSPAPKTPAPRPAPPTRQLTPVSATAFGPYSAGQGDNPQLAALAVDGDTATAWHTDWYTTAHLGNLYPGTGLLLDLGRPVTIDAARIVLGDAPGAVLQLRVGGTPSLADLLPVAWRANAAGPLRLRLQKPAHGRYALIWFTRLPQDPDGTFQASVYDLRLEGRP